MTEALWAAVDAITKPTTRRVMRDNAGDWLLELGDLVGGSCSVPAYRAAKISHGTIPSLWDQAETALAMELATGTDDGGSVPSPLSARSPASLDLMEVMMTMREQVARHFDGEQLPSRKQLSAKLRHLAADVVTNHLDDVDEWAYRISQWQRLLAVYLRNVETGPKPIRLRDTACPNCGVKQVRIEVDDTVSKQKVWQRVPPLLIDFRDGYIRAAECTNCATTWWRGDDLFELARLIADRKVSEQNETLAG